MANEEVKHWADSTAEQIIEKRGKKSTYIN